MTLLAAYAAYTSALYTQVNQQLSSAQVMSLKNQLYEGKTCGLLTNKESTQLLGQATMTSGTILPSQSLSVNNFPGQPRIDGCGYTSVNSSDAYIDVILKSYDSADLALKYYDQQIKTVFNSSRKDSTGYGDKLYFASGVYYLLKGPMIIEVSGAKPGQQDIASREVFGQTILQMLLKKL